MTAAPRSIFTGVPGWESISEQGLLISLALGVPDDGTILEIGSEFGMSGSIWAKYSKADVIICIDINPDAPYLENIKAAGIDTSRIASVTGDSRIAVLSDLIKDIEIDLLFVDGDHTFEGALSDLMLYAPRVKSGGIIAIHDTACSTNKSPHPLHYAVSSAIQHWRSSPNGKGFVNLFSVNTTQVFLNTGG